MTVVGGSTDHFIVDRLGNVQADAVLEVRTLAGVTVTDVTAPSGWTGQAFPAGKARADGDGYFKFVVPDATGPVQVRTAAHTKGADTFAAGPWLDVSGQIVPGTAVDQALAAMATDADIAAAVAAQAAVDSATYVPQADLGAASGVATLDGSGVVPDAQLPATLPRLGAAKNVFTQKIEVNGGPFTNAFDTALWVAPSPRTNPTISTQGFYTQHRVTGDMGAKVHDAVAAELRVSGATNATFLNAFEATAEVTGGANTIPDMRAITANFLWSGTPTGSISVATVIRAQGMPALPAGLTVDKAYGLYVEQQSRGLVENWSVYAPDGRSQLGPLIVKANTLVSATDTQTWQDATGARFAAMDTSGQLRMINKPVLIRNAADSGTFFSIGAGGPRWNDAGLAQTTVGAAGAAAALPATPSKYLKVQDSAGTTFVIPAYAAS